MARRSGMQRDVFSSVVGMATTWLSHKLKSEELLRLVVIQNAVYLYEQSFGLYLYHNTHKNPGTLTQLDQKAEN